MSNQSKKKSVSKESRSKQDLNSPDLKELMFNEVSQFIEKTITATLESNKDLLTAAVAKKIRQGLTARHNSTDMATVEAGGTWVGIDSLSRLRAIVGGRFQNLKARWVGAGFPLREHRGDKDDDYTLDEDGWIELSGWIAKQGFEIRRCRDGEPFLFEVKAVSGKLNK